MPETTALDRYFTAVTEANDAIVNRWRSGAERSARIANTLLAEFERGQHDAFDVTRKLAREPRDLGGFFREWMEATNRQNARNRELVRELMQEMTDATSENREAFSRILNSQRTAFGAAFEGVREVAGNAFGAARRGAAETTRRAAETVGDVAQRAENTAERAESAARETASRARKASTEAA